MREKKPFKCCYNCNAGIMYSDVKEIGLEYLQKRVDAFNATQRFCGNHYNNPAYKAFEKRYCKGFEPRTYGEFYEPESR